MIDPVTAIQIGLLLYGGANAIYHRWKDERWPENANLQNKLQIPLTAEGSPVPLIYGRVRVRAPVLAWYGNVTTATNPYQSGFYYYEGDLLFIVGIPFADGRTLLQGIFIGDRKIDNGGTPHDQAPNPGNPFSLNVAASMPASNSEFTQLFYEFLDGNSTQDITATVYRAQLIAAGVDATLIPSLRGYASILASISRNQPNLPSIGFELSAYPSSALYLQTVGNEANPADVLWDILRGLFGKLGLPGVLVDYTSFYDAAATLNAEGHGYSRAIESRQSAAEIIQEILQQIDAVMYQDQLAGLIKLKLIRADFDPSTIPEITPLSCENLEFADAGGWSNVYSKIRIVFSDRSQGYADGSATAQNPRGGSQQTQTELVLQFPGVCTQGLANRIAARELAARSRPILKCRATVDRTFYPVRPGDPIALSWPEANILGRVMRVGAINLGPPNSNKIVLDLVEDYFFRHRFGVDPGNGLPQQGEVVA
jgi:hypothetical protein